MTKLKRKTEKISRIYVFLHRTLAFLYHVWSNINFIRRAIKHLLLLIYTVNKTQLHNKKADTFVVLDHKYKVEIYLVY